MRASFSRKCPISVACAQDEPRLLRSLYPVVWQQRSGLWRAAVQLGELWRPRWAALQALWPRVAESLDVRLPLAGKLISPDSVSMVPAGLLSHDAEPRAANSGMLCIDVHGVKQPHQQQPHHEDGVEFWRGFLVGAA